VNQIDRFDELRRAIADSAADTQSQIARQIAESETKTRRQIAESAVETRRHFDVVAEALDKKIQIVAEGVIALSQQVDRFVDEVRDEFGKVGRRFLHLEARFERRFSDIERQLATRPSSPGA
jgi:hypothetical protein